MYKSRKFSFSTNVTMIFFSAILISNLFCGVDGYTLKSKLPTPAPLMLNKTLTPAPSTATNPVTLTLPTSVVGSVLVQSQAIVSASTLNGVKLTAADTAGMEVTLLPFADNTTTVIDANSNITTNGHLTTNRNETASSIEANHDSRASIRRLVLLIVVGVLFLILFMTIFFWWCCLDGEHSTPTTPIDEMPDAVNSETDGVQDITAVEFRHANPISPLLINTYPVPMAGPSASGHDDEEEEDTPLVIDAPPAKVTPMGIHEPPIDSANAVSTAKGDETQHIA